MSSPLPFPSSDDVEMTGTPTKALPSTPKARRTDASRPGTVARRALGLAGSARASASAGKILVNVTLAQVNDPAFFSPFFVGLAPSHTDPCTTQWRR